MNVRKILVEFLMCLLFLASTIAGQVTKDNGKEKSKCNASVVVTEKIKVDGAGWKTIKLRDIEFDIPTNFTVANTNCIEGGCLEFSRTDFRLRLDHNSAAWRPIVERKVEESYTEAVREDEIAKYWSWNMSGDEQSKYESGIVVWDEKLKNYVGGLYVYFNCPEDKPMVDKIIESVKYAPRSR